ncbi:MAG TPA: bifunctional serine/threonine-protein kinase/formylglycine-generating enzyme family protein [Pyrinomonadaceae bacterium]|nr:bifunctional serine/threonine-protein kinase/formylglycine-generating enzyme family protein [Pyrinomonadaceae bacterium]
MPAPNAILQNRYRIIRELGHGGMGAVYEAIDQRVSCVVALKETLIGKDSMARQAFEREAALLANLRHPGLPKVMDYFSEGAGEFLVMEFIPGHDLAELMDLRSGPFPESQVLQWADGLLKVLEYLHSRQPPIVHRDVKPSNLKVTGDGELFLLDFGLAKGAAGQMPTLMSDQSVVGYTPIYSPLEQIHGRGTDPRSDLYAFGATLYHMLTGSAPADAPARYAAIEEDEGDPLRPPRELNPQLSRAVSDIVLKAMSISRRHRQTSAAEIRAAFKQATAGGRNSQQQVRMLEAETLRQDKKRRAADDARRTPSAASLPATTPYQEQPQIEPTIQSAPGSKASEPPAPATIPAPFVPQSAPRARPDQFTNSSVAVESRLSRRLIVTVVVAIPLLIGVILWIWNYSGVGPANRNNPGNANQTLIAGDNKPNSPQAPAGMTYIPGGEFMMGRDDGDEYERPAHQVTVKPFFIDVHEVTLGDYMKFVRATGHAYTLMPSQNELQHPASQITWDDASAYAKWAGKRLPKEEEWEFAARGTDGRRYPWGNEWNKNLANVDRANGRIESLGVFAGQSPFGVYDMIGNVWEWTASELTAYPGGQLPAQLAADADLGAVFKNHQLKVIRGGAYDSDQNTATTTYRRGYPSRGHFDYSKMGFRCAQDVK